MISSHRTAFPLDKNKKKPVEQNLNTILNQCQIKMKEMILKKQDFIRKTNILAGKNNTLQEEISKLEKDIQDQRDDYEKKNELLTKKYEEINQNQLAYQEKIKEANEKLVNDIKIKMFSYELIDDNIEGRTICLKNNITMGKSENQILADTVYFVNYVLEREKANNEEEEKKE